MSDLSSVFDIIKWIKNLLSAGSQLKRDNDMNRREWMKEARQTSTQHRQGIKKERKKRWTEDKAVDDC